MIFLNLIFASSLLYSDLANAQEAQPVTAIMPTPQTQSATQASQTLIIFYDKTQTNAETLLNFGKKWQIKMLYDYQNFNAIAILVPNKNDLPDVEKAYQHAKGVLQVNREQQAQLQ